MKRTITVVFDGEVLRPTEPLDLEPNTEYQVTIERAGEEGTEGPSELLLRIASYAQDLGISDLAEQHDHYLYGTPKK